MHRMSPISKAPFHMGPNKLSLNFLWHTWYFLTSVSYVGIVLYFCHDLADSLSLSLSRHSRSRPRYRCCCPRPRPPPYPQPMYISRLLFVVSHIQRIGCQPEKTTLHRGQSRSWSAEQGKKEKGKVWQRPPPRALLVRRKK